MCKLKFLFLHVFVVFIFSSNCLSCGKHRKKFTARARSCAYTPRAELVQAADNVSEEARNFYAVYKVQIC